MRLHPYVRITGWPSLNGRHDVIRRLGQEGMDEICLPSMEWPLRAASIRPVDQAKGRERPQWVGRVEPAGRTIRWQMSIMGQPATTPPVWSSFDCRPASLRKALSVCARHPSPRTQAASARFGHLKQRHRCWRRLVGSLCLGAARRRLRRRLERRPSTLQWRGLARGN